MNFSLSTPSSGCLPDVLSLLIVLQIAMSILESILHDDRALEAICGLECSLVLDVLKMLADLVRIDW